MKKHNTENGTKCWCNPVVISYKKKIKLNDLFPDNGRTLKEMKEITQTCKYVFDRRKLNGIAKRAKAIYKGGIFYDEIIEAVIIALKEKGVE